MSSVLQKQFVLVTAVSVSAATETVIAYSGRVSAIYPTVRSIIKAWAQVTFGTLATTSTVRIRRGNGIAGAIVFTGTAENVSASTTSEVSIQFAEQLLNVEYTDYTFTLTIGSTGSLCTVNVASMDVELING